MLAVNCQASPSLILLNFPNKTTYKEKSIFLKCLVFQQWRPVML